MTSLYELFFVCNFLDLLSSPAISHCLANSATGGKGMLYPEKKRELKLMTIMDTLDNASPAGEEETFKQLNLPQVLGSHIVELKSQKRTLAFCSKHTWRVCPII